MRFKAPLVASTIGVLVFAVISPIGAAERRDGSFNWIFSDSESVGPSGALIADSGFRPYPNGFGFFNFGDSLRMNQVLFAQPEPLAKGAEPVTPVSLTARDMRIMFGPQVCLGRNPTGSCELTFSSQIVLKQIDGWAIAGRCFGLANVAAGFYSGQVSSDSLSTGAVNAFTTLNDRAQRKILRTVASQYFSATGYRATSMSHLIETLIADLSLGRISHTLLIYGVPGAHALTPYAIYSRGSNQFDIAVYDSNHPNKELALQVDLATNSFRYISPAQQGSPALTWDSQATSNPANLWVGSVASSLGRQECTFCAKDATATVVSFSPVSRDNAAVLQSIKVLDNAGQALDPSLYEVVPSMDSVLSPMVNGPVIKVSLGVAFAIALSGTDSRTIQPFSMTITQAGSTRQVSMDSLTQQASGVVGVGGVARSVSVSGTSFEKVVLGQTIESGQISYSFVGTQLSGATNGGTYMRVNEKRKRVYFRDNRGRKSTWGLKLRSAREGNYGAWNSGTVRLPRKARIIVEYAGFKGSQGRPSAWIDLDSNGSKDIEIALTSG